MGAIGMGRNENWLFVILQVNLPDCEVEVVHCEQQIWEEGGSLQSQCGPVFFLTIVSNPDVLSKLGPVVRACINWLDTPVYKNQVSFIRNSPEGWGSLIFLNQDSTQAQLSRTVLFKEIQF